MELSLHPANGKPRVGVETFGSKSAKAPTYVPAPGNGALSERAEKPAAPNCDINKLVVPEKKWAWKSENS